MKKTLVVLIGLLVIMFGLVGPAAAQTTTTPFTGVHTVGADLDPGYSWLSDGVFHWRGRAVQSFFDVSDDRLDGEGFFTLNLNWQMIPLPAMFTGPAWGEVYIDNDTGSWHGIWQGTRDENGHAYIRVVLHGEGAYEGLQARIWGERLTPDSTQPVELTGFILEPNG